jgi:putative flavoprotein involved in K+ transport
VTALRTAGGRFELTLADDRLAAKSVVVATGAFQQPTAAPPGPDPGPGILQLHTSAYRNPGQLPEGGVLIVGSGQSGCEIGQELLETGRAVHLSLGRCGWAPRRYRGREFLRWMVDVAAMDETPDVLPSPHARLAGNVAVSGTNGGRDCNPLVLERAGARLYGRFVRFASSRAVFAPDLDASLEFGFSFDAKLRVRFDEYAHAAGLGLPSHPPAPPRPGRDHDPTELDLRREGVRTVLWAGGFRPAFAWIDLPIFDELGFPRAERGVTDVPGLAFVGLPWLSKRKSPLLLGVGEDAGHVAGEIAAHLARFA